MRLLAWEDFQREVSAYGTNGRYAGVRALWIKVIIRAVFDWVSYKNSNRLMQRRLAEDASAWLFRPSLLFNSFENICFYLGLNPTTVRSWARSITRKQVSKIEILERYRNFSGQLPKKLIEAVSVVH